MSLTNPLINNGINNNNHLNQANMQVHLENNYMHNIMLGNMNASDLEYNMMYFNNNNIPNSNLGSNTDTENNNNNNNN